MSDPKIQERLPPAPIPGLAASILAAEQRMIRQARRNPELYNRLTITDEETGKPIKLAACHKEWHREITKNPRLGLLGPPEFGKTWQIVIGRSTWDLGYNTWRNGGVPRLRVAIGSNTLEQAEQSVGAIQNRIESHRLSRRIFPQLRPGFPWKSHIAWCQSPIRLRSPHLRAFGWFGAILGGRIDLLLLDDVDDFESTSTPGQRKKFWDWFQKIVIGRLTKNARVIAMGQVFHRDDLIHRMEKELGWKVLRTPIYTTDDQGNKIPTWEESWPLSRIEKRRRELVPAEFDRQGLCIARTDDEKRFDPEWIARAKARGMGKHLYWELDEIPSGCFTISGTDLGFGKKKKSGLCSITSILCYPNGDWRLLWVDAGRWKGPELLEKVQETQRRYKSTVYVESNAAQILLHDFAVKESDQPILPLLTGTAKNHPQYGIEGIATSLFNGKGIIPCNMDGICHPEVQELLNEMDVYTPLEHTGDRLMSLWFCMEGKRCRGGVYTPPVLGTRIIEPSKLDSRDSSLYLPEYYENGEDLEGEDYEDGWETTEAGLLVPNGTLNGHGPTDEELLDPDGLDDEGEEG